MGLLDDAKKKAEELAEEHGDTIEEGIDKVAEEADERTGGEHSETIRDGAEKAKQAVEDLAGDGGEGTGGSADDAGTG